MQELEIIESPEKAIALYEITPAQIAERLKAYDGLKVEEAYSLIKFFSGELSELMNKVKSDLDEL